MSAVSGQWGRDGIQNVTLGRKPSSDFLSEAASAPWLFESGLTLKNQGGRRHPALKFGESSNRTTLEKRVSMTPFTLRTSLPSRRLTNCPAPIGRTVQNSVTDQDRVGIPLPLVAVAESLLVVAE